MLVPPSPWHNGGLQFQTSPAGAKACYFAEARSLPQLLGGDSCYLAKDPVVSRATRRHRPSPPPRLLPELRPAPPRAPGESRAHLEPRAPGDQGARWLPRSEHSWWRAPSRIPLSEEARSSAQRITLSNCFPFYSQAGSCESLSVLLPVLQGRREAGGRGPRDGLAASPRARPERPGPGRGQKCLEPRSRAPGCPEPTME